MGRFYIPKNDGSSIVGNVMGNAENVGYRKFMLDYHARSIYDVMIEYSRLKGVAVDLDFLKMASLMEAYNDLSSIERLEIPECFKTLITDCSLDKKQQIKLLKGAEITPEQLGAMFMMAEQCGYLFTNIRYEYKPKHYSHDELPTFVYMKNGNELESSGDSSLSVGEMKNLVLHSNFLLARILSNDNYWHCFLQTRKGLLGEEGGVHGSLPHLHYISDSFGIDLADFKRMLRNGNYPTCKIHIPLKDYR